MNLVRLPWVLIGWEVRQSRVTGNDVVLRANTRSPIQHAGGRTQNKTARQILAVLLGVAPDSREKTAGHRIACRCGSEAL